MSEISIFDLPALHGKPSLTTLLTAINSLAVDLPSFEGPPLINPVRADCDATRYLTSIISSPLSWLPDDEARDAVWKAASLGLSERAGWSARPARTRTIEILSPSSEMPLQIHLHEPTLTSDHLGHKTWAAGYLLAKRLPLLADDVPLLQHFPSNTISPDQAPSSPPLVLELGSGTGLVGLALAHRAPATELHLTDLPTIVPNLTTNVERNFPLSTSLHKPEAREAPIHVFSLDWNALPSPSEVLVCEWTKQPVSCLRPGVYDLVIAADVLYGAEHPSLVARAAAYFVRKERSARVVVEVPTRERASELVDMLKEEMDGRGLVLRKEGNEDGWEEMGREEGRVKCWWGVWELRDIL